MKAFHEHLGDILLPDFLIVGAAKSATTSLHHYLDQHPDIRMASRKESWFFSYLDDPPRYVSPDSLEGVVSRLEDYVRLFEGARPEQRLGDASPSYLYTHRDTIRNIRTLYRPEYLEKLRIVISLRDPTLRAWSQYQTFARTVREPLAFEDATIERTIEKRLAGGWNIFYDYVGFGRYYEQVKAFFDAFGKEKVLVLLYEDIQRDPAGVCQSIASFIGVDAGFVPDIDVRYNATSGEPALRWVARALKSRNPVKRAVASWIPKQTRENILLALGARFLKQPALKESTRYRLARAFSDDISRLETLVGRDLSAWKHTGND